MTGGARPPAPPRRPCPPGGSAPPAPPAPRCPLPPVHPPRPRRAGARARVFEEGQIRAGLARLARIEQVVDVGIVLVDGLGDEPQPQHARVEVDVAGRVAGDGGDVVDAFESHESYSI